MHVRRLENLQLYRLLDLSSKSFSIYELQEASHSSSAHWQTSCFIEQLFKVSKYTQNIRNFQKRSDRIGTVYFATMQCGYWTEHSGTYLVDWWRAERQTEPVRPTDPLSLSAKSLCGVTWIIPSQFLCLSEILAGPDTWQQRKQARLVRSFKLSRL